MKSQIKVDIANGRIIVNSGFAKKAEIFESQEYRMLQRCRKDYPEFEVVKRSITSNPNKESYKGLTYGYMETYIRLHSDNPKEALFEFNELKLISHCHSQRYPVIKRWFLEKYPEVAQFGIPEIPDIIDFESMNLPTVA